MRTTLRSRVAHCPHRSTVSGKLTERHWPSCYVFFRGGLFLLFYPQFQKVPYPTIQYHPFLAQTESMTIHCRAAWKPIGKALTSPLRCWCPHLSHGSTSSG